MARRTTTVNTPANTALQQAQAAWGAATTPAQRQAAAAAGQAARAQGATDAGAQALWQISTPAPVSVPVRTPAPAANALQQTQKLIAQAAERSAQNPAIQNLIARADIADRAEEQRLIQESIMRQGLTPEQMRTEADRHLKATLDTKALMAQQGIPLENVTFSPYASVLLDTATATEQGLNPQTALTTQTGMSPQIAQSFQRGLDVATQMVGWATQQSADIQAMIFAGLESTLRMIAQTETELVNRFHQQMGVDDPQLRAAIGVLREEVQRQRDNMLEVMNVRGLSQSGIMLEMADRINRNELTQTQSLVAGRLGDLQNQLNSALMNLATARINTLGQFKGLGIQAAQQGGQQVLSAMGNLADVHMQQGQALQQQGVADRAFVEGQRQFNVEQTNVQNQFAEQQRQFNIGQTNFEKQLAETLRQFDATRADRQTQNIITQEQWQREFDEATRQFGVTARQQDRQLNIAAEAARNRNVAPTEQLTPWQQHQINTEEREYQTEAIRRFTAEAAGLMNQLKTGQMTYNDALFLLNTVYAPFYPPEMVQQFRRIIQQFNPNRGAPTTPHHTDVLTPAGQQEQKRVPPNIRHGRWTPGTQQRMPWEH